MNIEMVKSIRYEGSENRPSGGTESCKASRTGTLAISENMLEAVMSVIDRFFLSEYSESDFWNRQRAKDLVITSVVMAFLLLLLLFF